MISKLIAWGESRPQAIARMRRALAEYEVRGIKTTIPFFKWLLDDEAFVAGEVRHGFHRPCCSPARQGRELQEPNAGDLEMAAVAAALAHVAPARSRQRARRTGPATSQPLERRRAPRRSVPGRSPR